MTKRGTKLSEEHKANIGKATKRMWETGIFDSEKIRDIWRKTALSGIAKKGKEGPNKFVPSQEMLDDLSKMGDQDFVAKWHVSRIVPIKLRKRYGIQSFNKQHGTVEHRIGDDGHEYKYCQQGHWELVINFGKNRTRWDGLRGWCKPCERKKNGIYYDVNDGAKKARNYVKTEKGKESRRSTMRRVWAKRRGCYVKFELEDEKKIYDLCNQSCAYCKIPVGFDELEFDHFIPVKLGGLTKPDNMLPSCPTCNRGKGGKRDKDPYQWLLTRFGAVIGEQIYLECVSILEKLA